MENNEKYTREQICTSLKYKDYQDVLITLLEEDREYTTEETDNILKEFLNKEG